MIDKIARVAEILDEFKIILNKGERDGVEINDKFLIYGIGMNIIDPETNEDLGPVELVRGIVKVTHVQDKICTAKTDQKIPSPDNKRIISRSKPPSMNMLVQRIEKVEESISYIDKKLDNLEKGDFARPY